MGGFWNEDRMGPPVGRAGVWVTLGGTYGRGLGVLA